MKYIYSLLPVALGLIAGVSAQETSSTLNIPGPMEQSVTALSGTRTESSSMSMTSMTESSATDSSSTSSGSQAPIASSVIVNAGNPGSPTSTSPSAGSPGNVSQTGVSAAQNTGNPVAGAIGKQQALMLGLGVGAAALI